MKIILLLLQFVIAVAFISVCSLARAQTKPVAVVGATLIDGAGRAPRDRFGGDCSRRKISGDRKTR